MASKSSSFFGSQVSQVNERNRNFSPLTEGQALPQRGAHDVGAAYKAKRGKLVSGHATRSVVQDHLALALGHLLVESLEEIYATLRFNPGLRQESGQS